MFLYFIPTTLSIIRLYFTPFQFNHQKSRSYKLWRNRKQYCRHTRPPNLFLVDIKDSVISTTSIIMSCIRIHPFHCSAKVQRLHKSIQFTKNSYKLFRHHNCRFNFNNSYLRLLLFILLFLQKPNVFYSMPSTNYCVTKGQSSSTSQQDQYIDNILSNMDTHHNINKSSGLINYHSSEQIKHSHDCLPIDPYCFIVDTDSTSFVIDSGAN